MAKELIPFTGALGHSGDGEKREKAIQSDAALTHSYPIEIETMAVDENVSVIAEGYDSDEQALGRWGEEVVYRHLLREYPDHQVIWMNQEKEVGEPYDITIAPTKPGSSNTQLETRKGFVLYIEVKTTRAAAKSAFEITLNELEFMKMQGDSYIIYRLVDGSEDDSSTSFYRLKNPHAACLAGHLKLCLLPLSQKNHL